MQHKACADNVLHCDARKQQECKPPLQRLCQPVRAMRMVPAAFLLVFRGSFFNLCNLSNLWMICSFFPCRRTTAYGLPPFFWFIRRKLCSTGLRPWLPTDAPDGAKRRGWGCVPVRGRGRSVRYAPPGYTLPPLRGCGSAGASPSLQRLRDGSALGTSGS